MRIRVSAILLSLATVSFLLSSSSKANDHESDPSERLESHNVAVGKNGWLFFVGGGSGSVIRHETTVSPTTLEAWKSVLDYRTRALAERGIKYLFVVAPDKSTIYPEYLPRSYKPIIKRSVLDQIRAYIDKDERITFIDPSDALRRQKNSGLLYTKDDSHWNQRGAYFAYKEIIRALSSSFPTIEPIAASRIRWISGAELAGDLAQMNGTKSPTELVPEAQISPLPRFTRGATTDSKTKPLKLVFIHDSFGYALKPFLSETFDSIIEIHQFDSDLSVEDVAAQAPAVVIQEVVEREASALLPNKAANDWQNWVVQTILANQTATVAKSQWVNILPHTADINVPSLEHALEIMRRTACTNTPAKLNDAGHTPTYCTEQQSKLLPLKVTTCRVYSDEGETVSFDEKTAASIDWYLLKTEGQGLFFRNDDSQHHYQQYIDFVLKSKQYIKVAEHPMPDGSKLGLFKRVP